ncbi:MAG: DUF2950 family protein [Planctomycetes bacterium]|nr:DUF2950 family protein [Planctomycetota bacterium]
MTEENTVQAEPNTPSGETGTSKSAIWSLICGILSFLCLPAFPAIILGIVALVAISNSTGKLKGTGLAITGMIMAVVMPIIMTFFIIPLISIAAAIIIPNVLTSRPNYTPPDTWTPGDEVPRVEPDESLLSRQIPANESAAIASLRLLATAEALWRQQDPDGNGIKDYWTYDISCFYRMYRADNTTKIAFIAMDLARADVNTAETGDFGTIPAIEDWVDMPLSPKSGYYFQAMELDENGEPYNQVEVGDTKIKAANQTKFGFVAYPAEHGKTGRRTFIVNEQGTIYAIDVNPDVYGVALQWPGSDDPKDPYRKSEWATAD